MPLILRCTLATSYFPLQRLREIMNNYRAYLLLLLLLQVAVRLPFCACEVGCEEKLANCTLVMQPVLKEARYMFPTTRHEIDGMCKLWSHIMDCIRNYMSDCSSEEQKLKFNEAVSDSIDSVHAICSSERYRKDYLDNALCFKKVSMENCGQHFRKMVESAYNPLSLESHICCAYTQYEKCASEPIQRMCGPQTLQLLDHSMSSLKSRCDIITQKLKTLNQGCPSPDALMSANMISSAQRSPIPSPRIAEQTYSPLTASDYLMSKPGRLTTPAWTPRTVIYPLPATRQSSRAFKSGITRIVPQGVYIIYISAILTAFFHRRR